MKGPINAVIGVWHNGPSTYYVKRSLLMSNYPGVWSLFSIQFTPAELPDPRLVGGAVKDLFRRMSRDRLGGVPVTVAKYLTSGSSEDNPMGVEVSLHLYKIELHKAPRLNEQYYTDGAWLLPAEYENRCADQMCGLCLRLWADYAWLTGLTERPFLLPKLRSLAGRGTDVGC
jgi:hypothetical protein